MIWSFDVTKRSMLVLVGQFYVHTLSILLPDYLQSLITNLMCQYNNHKYPCLHHLKNLLNN
jgi:hypothetical protein